MRTCRTEVEWIQYRSTNKLLREEIEALKSREECLKNEILTAHAATEIARRELQSALESQSVQVLELAQARHGHKTDEIVTMGLKQMVKELEGQLLLLKEFTRDQAVKLSSTSEDAELLGFKARALDKVIGGLCWPPLRDLLIKLFES